MRVQTVDVSGFAERPNLNIAGLSVTEASRALQSSGWSSAGSGDTAIALADPSDSWCVRLTPFDPAYGLFADEVIGGAPNRWLPQIAAILRLAGEGYAVLMERLWPADPSVAQGFCDALGLPSPNDDEPPLTTGFAEASDPDFLALRQRIADLLTRGAARYPRLWGGSDVHAGNVLADAQGGLKLIDPVFLSGRTISDALLAGDVEALMEVSRAQLEAFLMLPCFHRRENRYEGVDLLRDRLAQIHLAPSDAPT